MKLFVAASIAAMAAALPTSEPPQEQARGLEIDLGVKRQVGEENMAQEQARGLEIDLGVKRHNAEENYAKRDDGGLEDSLTNTINSSLSGLCQQIGGTMTTQTVCQTVSGSDIAVSALNNGQTAQVTVSGRGLLQDASVTVPVESLDDILSMLG